MAVTIKTKTLPLSLLHFRKVVPAGIYGGVCDIGFKVNFEKGA
jgi:hypothetical protein